MPDALAPGQRRPAAASRSELRFLACGSVDDGKSTLIGRLINDATGLFDDQIEPCRRTSRRFGTTDDGIDFALLLDGLEAEREQGITIDVAYRFFSTPRARLRRRRHAGPSAIHAQHGDRRLQRRARRAAGRRPQGLAGADHAAMPRSSSLLGIRHVVLAVNKIDLVDFSEARFREIERGLRGVLAAAGLRIRSSRSRCRPATATMSRAAASARRGTTAQRCSPFLETVDTGPRHATRRRCASRCNGSIGPMPRSAASPAPCIGPRRRRRPDRRRGSGRTTRGRARIVSFDGDLRARAGRALGHADA